MLITGGKSGSFRIESLDKTKWGEAGCDSLILTNLLYEMLIIREGGCGLQIVIK